MVFDLALQHYDDTLCPVCKRADNDTGDVERPKGRDREVLDYVVRKGPITASRIVEDCAIWSPDKVQMSLESLESDGFIERRDGAIKDYGTTAPVWYVARGPERGRDG